MKPEPIIVDETQKDTKSREFAREMGIDRHEPMRFVMNYGPVRDETENETIARLILKVRNRGYGSFAASTCKGKTIKVTRVEGAYILEVRERGQVSRIDAVVERSDYE